jgi:hypothetical protein
MARPDECVRGYMSSFQRQDVTKGAQGRLIHVGLRGSYLQRPNKCSQGAKSGIYKI